MTPVPATDFKSIFESAPGLYLVLLPDFTIIAVSDAYLKATMTQREAILDHGLFEIFPDNPDDIEADGVLNLRASLNYVVKNKQPHTMAVQKYDIRRPDGVFEERYWSPLNTPILNSQNELGYIIHNVTDVTSRKKSEEQLQLLSLQINQSNDSIYTVDANRKIKNWNKGAENLYGFTKEEVLGKDPNLIFKTNISEQKIKAVIKEVGEQDYWTGELKRVTKSGADIWVRTSLTAIRDDTKSVTGYVSVSFNITEQKKLREEVDHLANMVEQSTEAIISTGPDQRIISWNKGAEKLHGYSKQEAIGKTAAELCLIKLTENEIENILQQVIEKGVWKAEMDFFHKSGVSFWGAVTANLVRNEQAEMIAVLFIVKDISISKKLEEQLKRNNEELEQKIAERTMITKRSEKQYRYLFENNPMPMWVIDSATFKFLDVNEMALLQYGYTRKEFLSMTAIDIRPDEDKASFIQTDHSFKTTKNSYNKGIWRHKKKDGAIIQVEIIAHEIFFEGVQAKLILSNDVTEQKKIAEKLAASEMHFRSLIENSAEGITLTDQFANVIYRSPGSYKITGVLPTENVVSLSHPEDLEAIKKKRTEILDNPGTPVSFQGRFLHASGQYIWLEGTFTNLIHVKEVNAIVTNYRDITKRKQLEELLHKANVLARIGGWEVDFIKGTIYWSDITREIHETEYNYVPDLETGISFYKEGRTRDLISQKIKEAIESGKPWDEELQIITAKNNERWIRTIGEAEFVDGKCIRIYGSFQDIDQRKRTEEKIIASEKQFRHTLDNMLEGAQIIGFDWQYLYVNDSFTRHSKYSRKELIGHTVMEKFPGIEQADIFKVYQRCFEERVSIHLENEFRFPDDTTGWFELSFQPIPEGIFILSIDITERKKAEQALLRSEARARRIFESNMIGFLFWREGGKILEANDYFLNMTGYTREDLKKGMVNWAAMTPPEYENLDIIAIQQIADTGICKPFEKEYIKKDGSRFPVSLGAASLGEKFDGIGVCYVMDISEHKQAEESIKLAETNYREIFDKASDAIYVHEIDTGRVIEVNQKAVAITGFSKDEILKSNPEVFITDNPDYTVTHSIAYLQKAAAGEPQLFDWLTRKKDGSNSWMEVNLKKASIAGQERILAFFREINDRKKAQLEVQKLNEELEQKVISRTEQLKRTNEELEAFSYSVSHDLRAPLRGIIGFTNILEEDYSSKLDDEAKRITGVIKTNTLKMGHLIDDLLAFSRMGRQELLKAPLDTNTMLHEIVNEMKKTATNPVLKWFIDPLPLINADIGTIRQVWINLIDNAIKYSAKKKNPQIEIGHYLKDGQQIFFVKDNGVGFNNEYRDKLFRVFQRLHNAEEFEGTGVGLALVGKIISKHGGEVWAEGIVNKGATFYFSLPVD